jgi:hypothetical protein
MKGLKPVKQNTDSTLIASQIADELQASINNVNNEIQSINSQLASINAELSKTNVTAESGTFSSLTTTNASITNHANVKSASIDELSLSCGVASRLDAHIVSADDVSSDNVSTHTLNTDNLNVRNPVNFNSVTTPSITATDANIGSASIGSTTTSSLNTPNANIGSLEVQSLRNVTDFDVNTLNATTAVNTPKMTATQTITQKLEANMAEMDKLFTQNMIFNTDETDPSQYITIDEYQSGQPSYIEIPAVASGFYRINVKKQNGKYFAVTLINTESTPIVQYDKDEPEDIDAIYYDMVTNKLYVKTYAYGKIFWSNNDKHGNANPVVYRELPIDDQADSTLRYRTAALHRVVIMGNDTLDYGFVVQGVLETNLIKDRTAYHQLFFYGDSYEALKKMCDLYLRWEDPNDHTVHYTTSETAGYLQHTDSNYRDPATNQETEAIEKISYDGTKVTLTIDAKYGQDEIEIDDSVGTELRFNENGLPPLSDVEHFIESLTGYSIEVINNMSTEIRVEKGKTILYITHNDLQYPGRTVYIINEIGSGVGRAVIYLNDGNHIIYDTFINGNFINTGLTVDGDLLRTSDPLPFVLSFTMSAIAWDKIMNTEVYNSWAVDRS